MSLHRNLPELRRACLASRRGVRLGLLLAAMVVCAAAEPGPAVSGGSPPGVHVLQIPAGPLAGALNRFAEVSGLLLIYDSALTKDRQTGGLHGAFATEEALRRLLEGSGLEAVPGQGGAYTIRARPLQESISEAVQLPKVLIVGRYSPDEDPQAYLSEHPSVATKTPAPLLETPFSVQAIPPEVLKDQQTIRLDRALLNTSGVQPQPTNGQNSDSFMLRGFQNDTLYREGFPLPSALGGGTSKRETANIERIEVLKGPASLLYGRTGPGGIINLVPKKPQSVPYHALQQQFGSFDFYRTTLDSTGPLTGDAGLMYRINAAYEDSDSFRDFQQAKRSFLAPTLRWNLSGDSRVDLELEYQHFDETGDTGIPPLGGRPAPVPRSREFGEKINNRNVGDRVLLGLHWTYALNDRWGLSYRFGTEHWDKRSRYTFLSQAANPDGLLFGRAFNNGNTQQQAYYSTVNLTGRLDTGAAFHQLLFGLDSFVVDNQEQGNCCYDPSPAGFDINRPVYRTSLPSPQFQPGPNFAQTWHGVYGQDQISLPHDLHAHVGLRFDTASVDSRTPGMAGSSEDYLAPRGGLLWQPVSWGALYGSYGENFGAGNNLGLQPGQKPLPPQTASQWEMGAKASLLDGRVSASYAYFDLTQRHVGTYDYACSPMPCPSVMGRQHSRGHELEIAGEPLPGWRTIGAYTHLNYASVEADGPDGHSGNAGRRMFMTPRHFGSWWNTYEFVESSLKGLKLGAGVVASSMTPGSNTNDFLLPGYVVVNLLIAYGLKFAGTKVTAQLNVENLLDKTYYKGTNTSYAIGVGAPRTLLGSVRVEF